METTLHPPVLRTTASSSLPLPSTAEMYAALVRRDAGYEGVFVAAIRTTGVFCRPGCPARTPRPENVEFFAAPRAALLEGYRPCLRCRPMEPRGAAPEWLRPVLERLESEPVPRLADADLRALGADPRRVRRWFLAWHGMTFHAYQRARRLGRALGRIRHGASASHAAQDGGFESESAFREAFARLFGTTPGRGRDLRQVWVTRLPTPLGPMVAAADERALCLLEFADRRMLEAQVREVRRRLGAVFAPGTNPVLDQTARELEQYFAGARRTFDVPVYAPGTPFQERVWRELRAIPCGETRSYDQIARTLGAAGARRAVGRANGLNRVAIVIPCHRVVRADGSAGGYAGGRWRKERLLALERGIAGD